MAWGIRSERMQHAARICHTCMPALAPLQSLAGELHVDLEHEQRAPACEAYIQLMQARRPSLCVHLLAPPVPLLYAGRGAWLRLRFGPRHVTRRFAGALLDRPQQRLFILSN